MFRVSVMSSINGTVNLVLYIVRVKAGKINQMFSNAKIKTRAIKDRKKKVFFAILLTHIIISHNFTIASKRNIVTHLVNSGIII